MKVILMDLSRLDLSSATPAATTDTAMDREALENILGTTLGRKAFTDILVGGVVGIQCCEGAVFKLICSRNISCRGLVCGEVTVI